MLHISNHCRVVQVILLHGVLGAQGEKRCSWAVACDTTRVLYCGNRLVCDMLGSHIPGIRFSGVGKQQSQSFVEDTSCCRAHPSRYCTILPFFDQAINLGSADVESVLFKILMTRGVSLPGGFATLQTLRSPFADCVANMSDFCFDEEACHANVTIGDGPRDVVRVCKMVKVG